MLEIVATIEGGRCTSIWQFLDLSLAGPALDLKRVMLTGLVVLKYMLR